MVVANCSLDTPVALRRGQRRSKTTTAVLWTIAENALEPDQKIREGQKLHPSLYIGNVYTRNPRPRRQM